MTDYTKLIERLKLRNENGSLGEITEGDQLQAADAIEAMQAENERLKRELEISRSDVREWCAQADALQAKLDAMGKGGPVGFVAPHDLKTLREGYPATVVMLPSNKRTEPLYTAPKALAPSREVIGRYMADKGFYLSKEALDGLMLKLEGIGGTP